MFIDEIAGAVEDVQEAHMLRVDQPDVDGIGQGLSVNPWHSCIAGALTEFLLCLLPLLARQLKILRMFANISRRVGTHGYYAQVMRSGIFEADLCDPSG